MKVWLDMLKKNKTQKNRKKGDKQHSMTSLSQALAAS